MLVAGGFLLVYGYLSIGYEWEYWGGIIFFVGLFIGVLGVLVSEEKTKIMLKALGASVLITMIFMIATWGIYSLLYPQSYIMITGTGLIFFFILVSIIAYVAFYLMEKEKS
ncbi:MAG: hypothetical protein HXX80_01910 [Nitrososphaerales archaeon]|nr:hypothetical protein [Nitrososphaerales archaeon]